MGIFAQRHIKAGEELTFDYNVDRYGADPQPCYCGEPNCSGFLGGKTQTERGTKLAHDVVEALGIEDGDDFVVPYIAIRDRRAGYGVSIVKAGLTAAGRPAGPVRPPLTDLTDGELAELTDLVKKVI